MEDRFKFRAWDKKNKKMRTSFGIHNEMGLPYINNLEVQHDWILIQSIGLKDMDGKLIYEKYIIEDINFPKNYYKVVFDDDTCQYKFLQIKDNRPLIKISKRYCENCLKIIGNEFENPELLTKKQTSENKI